MQIGTLTYAQRIYSLHPRFKKLFDFVSKTDFNTLPKGKNVIDGDDLYIMNLDIAGADISTQPLEMHQKYIDVHIVLDGVEQIGWKSTDEINHYVSGYQEDGDCALSDDKPSFYVTLHKGQFAIVFPEDAHAPAISEGHIRKLIGKVRL